MADTNLLVLAREYKKLREEVKKVLSMPKGDKGDQGEKGEKGDTGDTGPQGFPGRDGKDGINGYDGKDGLNGNDGKDGKDGLDGVGVQNAYIDFDNSLVIVLTDGREVNAGYLSQETKDNVVATFKQGAATIDELLSSPITVPVEVSVNSTSAALKLTQTGTGPALLVEDSTSPDVTPTVIDQFGNVILGKDSRFVANGNKVEIHSTITETNGLLPSIGLYNWSSSSSSASHISFRHYPSGTVGTTTTANASGDTLGRIRFFTQDGAGNSYSGGISGTTASDLLGVNLSYGAASHQFTGGPIIPLQVNFTVNTVPVTSNAGTIPITHRLHNFTNSSAAAMTITLTTTGAVDGQMAIIRIYDASAATQSISWVNTENSAVSVPTTSNGSTTLPLTVGFMYNNATSRWRCIASA